MSLIRDNFVKLLIISLYNTKSTTFSNMCENVITTYKLMRYHDELIAMRRNRL